MTLHKSIDDFILHMKSAGHDLPETLQQIVQHWPGSVRSTHTSSKPSVAEEVNLDLDRQARCGYPEVIFGEHKTADQILQAITYQQQAGQPSLVTRCDPSVADIISQRFPRVIYHSQARTLRLDQCPGSATSKVFVLTAGTSDAAIAHEAHQTLLWMGTQAEIIMDVGVAGPARLLAVLPELQQADCLIVVAGMEGALPSVVAGWVDCPVIAVPTSRGYGANLQGLTALLGMLTSCAANVGVVNIDAGFKAGYLAGLIANRHGSSESSK